MTVKIEKLERVFLFNGSKLQDVNPESASNRCATCTSIPILNSPARWSKEQLP